MDVTLLHHTSPLGVTVALYQACLVAKNGSISGSHSQANRQAGRLRIQEGGNKGLERGLHTSVPVAAGYAP